MLITTTNVRIIHDNPIVEARKLEHYYRQAPLKSSTGNPSANHPKSMSQLSAVHYKSYDLPSAVSPWHYACGFNLRSRPGYFQATVEKGLRRRVWASSRLVCQP